MNFKKIFSRIHFSFQGFKSTLSLDKFDEGRVNLILILTILLLWNLLFGPKFDNPFYLSTKFQAVEMSSDVLFQVKSLSNFNSLDIKTKNDKKYYEEVLIRNQLFDFELMDTTDVISSSKVNFHSPIHPVFIYIINKLHPGNKIRIQNIMLMQRFLDSLIIVLLFLFVYFHKNYKYSIMLMILFFYLIFYKKFYLASEQSLLILDSSLAGFIIIVSVFFGFALIKNLSRSYFYLFSFSLSILFMLRNEFILLVVPLWLCSSIFLFMKKGLKFSNLLIALLILTLIPTLWGFRNLFVYDSFRIMRTQSGQNLYEAIGQFENKLGIKYSDVWIDSLVANKGLEYKSRDADEYLMNEYFKVLKSNPEVLFNNFWRRVEIIFDSHILFGKYFLLILLFYVYFIIKKKIQLSSAVILLAFGLFIILFYSWTHYLARFVYPITYLSLTIILQTIFAFFDSIKSLFTQPQSKLLI